MRSEKNLSSKGVLKEKGSSPVSLQLLHTLPANSGRALASWQLQALHLLTIFTVCRTYLKYLHLKYLQEGCPPIRVLLPNGPHLLDYFQPYSNQTTCFNGIISISSPVVSPGVMLCKSPYRSFSGQHSILG